jgi:3-oxoacyl-[acyl-carrier protein] reductase
MLLKDKVCLITGAGKGIGKAIAERFAQEGATVYANARTENSLDEWSRDLGQRYNTAVIPVYFDVTDNAGVKNTFTRLMKDHQRLDVLVNNAGLVSYEMMNMISMEHLRKMFDVNVIAVIQLMQFASRLMQRQKSGSIVNISSIVGVKGVKGQLGYSATKGAVLSVTKSAAKELAEFNIRVNAVAPGMISTDRLMDVFEKKFSDRLSSIGFGRLGTPEEVADTCVYLASDLSKYVSGQVIGVDGSMIL